jgi:hypothetical protein
MPEVWHSLNLSEHIAHIWAAFKDLSQLKCSFFLAVDPTDEPDRSLGGHPDIAAYCDKLKSTVEALEAATKVRMHIDPSRDLTHSITGAISRTSW